MEIKKEESEFAQFPVDQVVDWLGHPVTEHLKSVIADAISACDRAASDMCETSAFARAEDLKSAAMANGAGKKAYKQLKAFIEEAGEYVKA